MSCISADFDRDAFEYDGLPFRSASAGWKTPFRRGKYLRSCLNNMRMHVSVCWGT